jgi:hypothetical protein
MESLHRKQTAYERIARQDRKRRLGDLKKPFDGASN